jgi:hypothetical protein
MRTIVRTLLVSLALCGQLLMPLHTHAEEDADCSQEACQLCVLSSSGLVMQPHTEPDRPGHDRPLARKAHSVTTPPVPPKDCRDPPRN